MGLEIDEDLLHTLLFADDQIIMANDDYDIEYMIRKLSEVYTTAGLKINFSKTKYLVIGAEGQDIEIDGKVIEYCQEYKYLGTIISKEVDCRKEICNRVG